MSVQKEESGAIVRRWLMVAQREFGAEVQHQEVWSLDRGKASQSRRSRKTSPPGQPEPVKEEHRNTAKAKDQIGRGKSHTFKRERETA